MFKRKKQEEVVPGAAQPEPVAARPEPVDLEAWFGPGVAAALGARFSPDDAQAFVAALAEDAKDRYLAHRAGSVTLTDEETAALREATGGNITLVIMASAQVKKAWFMGAGEATDDALGAAGLSPELALPVVQGLTEHVQNKERRGAPAGKTPRERIAEIAEAARTEYPQTLLAGVEDPSASVRQVTPAWPTGSVAKCDVCGTVNPSPARLVPSDDFRTIAAAGYNPYAGRAKGTPLYERARELGTSEGSMLDTWRDIVRRDTSGWGICELCADEVAPFLTRSPA